MRLFLRFIIFIATIVGVIALLIGGIGLGTGNFDFLESLGLPNPGSIQTAPSSPSGSAPAADETPGAPDATIVLRFTWSGDQILNNETPITEAEFAELLAEAKEKDVKIEIVKLSDVSVESADRRRQMLDEAGVRYEVIPQE